MELNYKQPSNEIKELPKDERIDRVLKYVLNLPDDISSFSENLNAQGDTRLQGLWEKLEKDWEEVKSVAEEYFKTGREHEGFVVNGQKYILYFNGSKELLDVDKLHGPTIEEKGEFKVRIDTTSRGVSVTATQVKQGWCNAELDSYRSLEKQVDRTRGVMVVPMRKNGCKFNVEYEADFDPPTIVEYTNTALVVQEAQTTTPIGKEMTSLQLFDARKAEVSSDLPSGGIDHLIEEAATRYLDILGISKELISKIKEDAIDLSKLTSLKDALELYSDIKKGCGESKGFDLYGRQIGMLNLVQNLLNPEYIPRIYSVTSDFKYESPDGGDRVEAVISYYVGVSRVDNAKGDIHTENSYAIHYKTIECLKKIGILPKPNVSRPSGYKEIGPPTTVDTRIALIKLILDDELDIEVSTYSTEYNSYDRGIYHHLVWWKQHQIVEKAIELAKSIDLGKAENDLLGAYKSRLDELKKWVKKIDEDHSIKNVGYYSQDGREEYHYRRNKLAEIGIWTSRAWSPVDDVHNFDIGLLTSADCVGIHKVMELVHYALNDEYSKDEYVFEDPPLEIGQRVYAKVSVNDETITLQVDGVRSEHWKIQKEKGNLAPTKILQDDRESQYSASVKLSGLGEFSSKIALSDGFDGIPQGTLPVEVIETSRKGHKSWKFMILSPEYLEKERNEVLEQVKGNLPLRKMATEIDSEYGLYGMPVDQDGKPCEEHKADRWVMYEKYHKWANAYPDAFILVPMRGFRSKSSGKTFKDLKDDYYR